MGFRVKQSSNGGGSGETLTASQILTLIKSVDGVDSGLDADLVRGVNPSNFLTSETDPTVATFTKGLTSNNSILTALNAATGTISSNLLPSYVDDVLNYTSIVNFPVTGEVGKIYVAEDSNKTYRWGGVIYVEISSSATAGEALKLTTPRTISTTGDANYSVSFDGSTNVSAAITLATVNGNVGSFGSATQSPVFTVDGKGRITAVANNTITPSWSAITSKPTTLSGFGITDAQPIGNELTAIQALADTVGFLRKTGDGTYSIDTSSYLTGNQSISVSGDASGAGSTAITLTLANSGVTAGTYNALATQVQPFTIDSKGRITSTGVAVAITPPWSAITGKPTTLSGFGITDGQPLDNDLTTIAGFSQTNKNIIISNGTNWITRQIDIASDSTGILPVAQGGTGGSGQPAERVLLSNFSSSSRLQWLGTSGFFGIGTGTPAYNLDVFGGSRISGQALFTNTTPSTSPTTGANIVAGGQGVGGDQWVGGSINGAKLGNGADATSFKFGGNNATLSTGTNWSAFGLNAGAGGTTGTHWCAFGAAAGQTNTTGINWSAFGTAAGQANISGGNWCAFGYSAGLSNNLGGSWCAFGTNAGNANTTGSFWSAFGAAAGQANISGGNWCAFGRNAGRYTAVGDGTTLLTDFNNSCYFGALTKGTEGATNENVFGYSAIGNGSNTITIGDSNITNNFFRGALSLNGTQIVSSRQSGHAPSTGTLSRVAFNTETVTLLELARQFHALKTDLTTHGLIGA